MEENPGTLHVSVYRITADKSVSDTHPSLEHNRTYVVLNVADTGHGMDNATQERIYDPFFTTKEQGRGTGLGLATVHGIVTNLGGTIEVKSAIEQGTSFTIYLPLAYSPLEQDEAEIGNIPEGNGERLLFVDDEEVILGFGQQVLRQLGYQVTTVSSSLAALELFRGAPDSFDLVITDQIMPGMTGLQLAHNIRRIRNDIPIIAATGYSETLTPEAAEEVGIAEMLQKPFTKATVARAVYEALRSNVNAPQ